MHFRPQVLKNVFSEDDVKKLRDLIDNGAPNKKWVDGELNRGISKYPELEEYFSKKLEPLAIEIFGDETLKTSYSLYLDYNKPTSSLYMHLDQNACVYTLDYCLSAKTPWGLIVGDEEFMFGEGETLAFMGGHDMHGRNPMPDPDNNRVELIMFHFVPSDHWFFTEGPDYIYKKVKSNKPPYEKID